MAVENNSPEVTPSPEKSRFSELDELQREISQRIKDNQRFLEGFLSDDYADEDESEDEHSDFEEL